MTTQRTRRRRRINFAFLLCMIMVWICSLWWRTHTYNTMTPGEWTWYAWVLSQGSTTGLIGWYLARATSTESEEAEDGRNPPTVD